MRVLGRAVLILPHKMPEKVKSLFIPETSKEMELEWGTVVQAGPACNEIRDGMMVNFSRKSASIIVIDDIEHFFIYENKILYYE